MSLTAWIISAVLVGCAVAILVWIHKEAKAYKREKEEIAQRLRDEAREQEEARRRHRTAYRAGDMERVTGAGIAKRRADNVPRRDDESYSQRRRGDEPLVDPYAAAAVTLFAAQDSAPPSDFHSASGWSGGGGDSGGAGASGSWDSGSSDSSSSSYDSGSSSDSSSFSSD